MTSSGRVRVVIIGLVPTVLAGTVLTACSGKRDEASRQLPKAAAEDSRGDAHDPCTLLSAGEAAPYVGALAAPPYRASDGAADVRGDECMYRGTDGRQVTVLPDWSGGEVVGRILRDVPNVVGNALHKAGATGMDTMTHRVMQQGPAGPWDQATWIPGGSLFASRGEAQVSIDVSGASGQERDAVALATVIMPRFDHPLAYDGAKAVALAPKPRTHPANACDFIPRPEIEAAIGPLDGAPTSDAPERSCTYRVATAQGERSYPVEFLWEGGQKNYMMLKHGMATVGGLLGTPSSSPLDTMKPSPQMQRAIGGLMKMVGGASGEGGASAAPGAAATIGFRTDTTLTGPWDNAALLHGTQLIAVRRDVFVGVSLQSADYDKAKALLAAICARL
jgi:hypothetical protein